MSLTVADGGFTQLFVDFSGALREAGLPIGTDDVMALCQAVTELNPTDIMDTYWAGRTTLVTRREHIPVYDNVFRHFFLDEELSAPDDPRLTMRAATNSQGVLEVPDTESSGDESNDEEITLGYMASPADVRRNKHFSECTPEELAALRRIMSTIRVTPPRRRTRRREPAARGRSLHLRKMVLETMRRHGEPNSFIHSRRRRRVRPLILLLDVSGSMADYSRNLLQFAYSTRRASGRVEVFCFGTRLTRITRQLDRRRPDEAMAEAAQAVFDWDGGTRIGDSIATFVQQWGRRGMARGGIVVICSDGLDRGDPEALDDALERLERLCHQIVWMNPHVGDNTDIVPNSVGMLVAEPYIDKLLSGHNLRSLEEFARVLPELG